MQLFMVMMLHLLAKKRAVISAAVPVAAEVFVTVVVRVASRLDGPLLGHSFRAELNGENYLPANATHTSRRRKKQIVFLGVVPHQVRYKG